MREEQVKMLDEGIQETRNRRLGGRRSETGNILLVSDERCFRISPRKSGEKASLSEEETEIESG